MSVIEYSLVRSDRKSIAIVVRPDQSVEIRVPHHISQGEVEQFFAKKRRWVESTLEKFSSRPLLYSPISQEGEKHYFLGEKNTIRDCLHHGENGAGDVKNIILQGIRGKGEDKVEKKLHQWYREKSLTLLVERHEYWRNKMKHLNLPESHVCVRKMRRRWGSCTSAGKITFNTQLVKYPLQCIDVVVVHELCHLLEFSHNKRFYGYMDRVYPDWKQSDALLRNLSWEY